MSRRGVICIVTPSALGSNPRVVKEADALIEAGYRVRVISTRTLARVDERDDSILSHIRWSTTRIDLRAKWRWRRLRAPQAIARQLSAIFGPKALATRAFSAYTPALTRAALQTPADLYIAHYPAALPAVAAAARRHGGAYAYDAEDFHYGDWPLDRRFDLDRALVREIESRFLPACAYVTAAAPAIAEAYEEHYRIARPHVVLNCFPVENGPKLRTDRGSASPAPSVYWFSQTIGYNRGLECAVRAIAEACTRPHLYLRGSLQPGFGERLRALAEQSGVEDRVHLLDPAAPQEMERLAATYDLGLCGETGFTPNNSRALSNKLFSYLMAGIPPLMSATKAQADFADEVGVADWVYAIDDSSALAARIDALLSSPVALAAAREKASRLAAERFNWNIESRKLADIVGRAAAAAEPASSRRGGRKAAEPQLLTVPATLYAWDVYRALPPALRTFSIALRHRSIWREIEPNRRIVLVHIPKCAGTTLSMRLYSTAVNHYPLWVWRESNRAKFAEGVAIAVVRDPVARLISAIQHCLNGERASQFDYDIGDWIRAQGADINKAIIAVLGEMSRGGRLSQTLLFRPYRFWLGPIDQRPDNLLLFRGDFRQKPDLAESGLYLNRSRYDYDLAALSPETVSCARDALREDYIYYDDPRNIGVGDANEVIGYLRGAKLMDRDARAEKTPASGAAATNLREARPT